MSKRKNVQFSEEMMKILQSFHVMIKQVHNFEIARIHQDSYVQYLQLLSQVILNCRIDQ